MLPSSHPCVLGWPRLQTFQCNPIAAARDYSFRPPPRGTGEAKSFDLDTFIEIGLFNGGMHRARRKGGSSSYLTTTVTNIITDTPVVVLPIPVIWQLQLRLRTRVVLVVILSLGTLAGIASGMREGYQGPLDENDWYALWNPTEL